MSSSVEKVLPEWRVPPSSYLKKSLIVYKKKEKMNEINLLLLVNKKKKKDDKDDKDKKDDHNDDKNDCDNRRNGLDDEKKDYIIFGRKKETCDVLLEHQSISRQHAVMFFGEMGAVYLMDLGSSHGTHVNGERITEKEAVLLSNEDEIVFGQSSRHYRLDSHQKKPAVPLFEDNGKKVHSSEAGSGFKTAGNSTSDSKEDERKRRQDEINAMAEEMKNTVPIFQSSVKVNETNREDLNKARAKAEAEADGATVEYDFNEIEDLDVDVEELEEVSDSDDEKEDQNNTPNNEKIDKSFGKGAEVDKKNNSANSSQSKSQSESDMETFSLEKKIPLSHQIDLRGHSKAVTCLSCEAAGNRIVTGSLDYNIRLYDFGGMDMRHRAFKALEVQDGYPVAALAHTPSGDKFIACTGSCQPKIYTRDGEEVITFVRGDMYLRDLSNTKGHTMEVTGAQWHPMEKMILLTSSLDGTLRIWDLKGEANFGNLCNKSVLKIRGKSGQPRVGARCCAYSLDGSKMLGGATDGSIHIWNAKKHYTRADYIIENANVFDSQAAVMSIVPSPCNPHVYASRGEDGTLRLWEINKKFSSVKKPKVLRTFSKVENIYPTANVDFSPDGSFLCCGTSPSPNSSEQKSMLYFFDLKMKKSPEKVPRAIEDVVTPCLGIVVSSEDSAIFVQWQQKSNQIFCSTSGGFVRVFFDPRISVKGAVITAGRAPKREKDPSDYATVGEIYNPHALPMYRQESLQDAKRKRAERRKDPVVSKIPEKSIPDRGQNSNNQSFFFTKYVMEGRAKNTTGMDDPREALLKMDNLAQNDPIFFGRAYEKNQPVKEMHSETFEEEQEQFKKRQKKF